jgi:hypothetical protein
MSMLKARRQMPAQAGGRGNATVKPGVNLSATKRPTRDEHGEAQGQRCCKRR